MMSILTEGGTLRVEMRAGASQVIVRAAVTVGPDWETPTWVMDDRIFSDPMSALVHLAVLLDPPREAVVATRHRPTHVCNACGVTIAYGEHAHGCPGCECGAAVGVLHQEGCPSLRLLG